jgi:hypothetical protein
MQISCKKTVANSVQSDSYLPDRPKGAKKIAHKGTTGGASLGKFFLWIRSWSACKLTNSCRASCHLRIIMA